MTVPSLIRMLKLATKDLVRQFEDQTEAGHVLNLSQQQISRMCDKNTCTNVISLEHAIRLESAADEPCLTQLMAKQAGGIFIRLPDDLDDAQGLPMHVFALVKEVGECADRLRAGLADGELDPEELAALECEFDDVVEKAVLGRAQVRAMQGKKAAPVRLGGEVN